jgi:hypothetical protein
MSTEDDILNDAGGNDELSSLYHKADSATPPASLDATIIAAAKQAVEHKSVRRGSSRAPFSGGWPVAISAVAVIVVAILLAPMFEQQAPQTDTAPLTYSTNAQRTQAEQAKENSERERKSASAPARLYAPAPVQQQPAATGNLMTDEDSALATHRSTTTAQAPGVKKESPEHRSQTGLNPASGAPLAIFTPEMWLVKIQHLIDSGKIPQARDELDRFRLAHPDYELDQNLLERLKQP